MILELGMTEFPNGIHASRGMCGETKIIRDNYGNNTSAFTVSKNTMLTVASTQVFPSGFPVDFSILLVIKPTRKIGRVPIFSMYSSENEEVLTLLVGSQIVLYYQDTDGNPFEDSFILFEADIDDEK